MVTQCPERKPMSTTRDPSDPWQVVEWAAGGGKWDTKADNWYRNMPGIAGVKHEPWLCKDFAAENSPTANSEFMQNHVVF